MRVRTINYFIAVCLIWLGIIFVIIAVSDALFPSTDQIERVETDVSRNEAPKADVLPDLAISLQDRLNQGDVNRGKKIFGRCALCHTPIKDGPNRVGPPLYGVVGRRAALIPYFSYSQAMRQFGKTGARWDEQTLDIYLRGPQQAVQGTTMSFAGIASDQDRADLILYLKTLSDQPRAVSNNAQ